MAWGWQEWLQSASCPGYAGKQTLPRAARRVESARSRGRERSCLGKGTGLAGLAGDKDDITFSQSHQREVKAEVRGGEGRIWGDLKAGRWGGSGLQAEHSDLL